VIHEGVKRGGEHNIRAVLTQGFTSPAIPLFNLEFKQQENFKPDGFGRLGEADHPCITTCDKILYTYDAAGNF